MGRGGKVYYEVIVVFGPSNKRKLSEFYIRSYFFQNCSADDTGSVTKISILLWNAVNKKLDRFEYRSNLSHHINDRQISRFF